MQFLFYSLCMCHHIYVVLNGEYLKERGFLDRISCPGIRYKICCDFECKPESPFNDLACTISVYRSFIWCFNETARQKSSAVGLDTVSCIRNVSIAQDSPHTTSTNTVERLVILGPRVD